MEIFADIKFNVQLAQTTFCKYELTIDDKQISLTFPQLLQLRQKVNHLTSPVKLTEIIDNENFVLLFVADREHVLFLEIPQLLDLKDEISYYFSVS